MSSVQTLLFRRLEVPHLFLGFCNKECKRVSIRVLQDFQAEKEPYSNGIQSDTLFILEDLNPKPETRTRNRCASRRTLNPQAKHPVAADPIPISPETP